MHNPIEHTHQRISLRLIYSIGLAVVLGLSPLHALTKTPRHSSAGGRSTPSTDSGSLTSSNPAPPITTTNPGTRLDEAYGKLPLSFEANQGQTDPRVSFLSRGNGYCLFLTPTEAVLTLSGSVNDKPAGEMPSSADQAKKREAGPATAVLRIRMKGSNPEATASGMDQLPGKTNYYFGNDPGKWRADVPTYAKVKYGDVYPGIDLIYYGNQRQFEYDYVVSPGADPSIITLAFEGAEKVSTNDNGDIMLNTAGGSVIQRAPTIYQEIDGARKEVSGRYVLKGRNEASFEIGEYDKGHSLVIDPLLSYSTYLGGSGTDKAYDIAVDASGNAFITGYTLSSNFPKALLPPSSSDIHEVFVSKMNPAGSGLLYSTYVGGSSEDEAASIAVDTSGNAYITGYTNSTDFPIKAPYQSTGGSVWNQDAFVTKLNASGAILYSTYLGGGDKETGYAIAVDSARNIYVAGTTNSTDLPTRNAYQASRNGGNDAFLTKLNAAGSALLYSTYLGSIVHSSSDEEGYGLAVDSSGYAYMTGSTDSSSFPTSANAFRRQLSSEGKEDAYIAKFLTTASGTSSLVYSSYIGGTRDDDDAWFGGGYDKGFGIVVDASGVAYVTGETNSQDFPVKNGFQSVYQGSGDAFVIKVNTKPTVCTETATDNCKESLMYSTYLGGEREDGGRGIAVDPQGNIYLTGHTSSVHFPLKSPFQSSKTEDSSDAFLTKLNPKVAGSASLIYSSFLKGTSGIDEGRGIALDAVLNIYLAGFTQSSDFIKKNPYQSVKGAGYDAFIIKVSDQPVLTSLTITPTTVLGSKPAVGKVTLSAPAPALGAKVTLTDTLSAASVPAYVTIPAGATSQSFTITTVLVSTLQSGNVSAAYNGITKSAALKVRPIGVASLTLSPNPVVGPNKATGTVTLELPAAPGNITVTLSSSSPSVANPAVSSMVIPAGVKSKTFTVNTADVLAPGSATIKATANGVFKAVLLKVN